MTMTSTDMFQEILARKEGDLSRVLRNRDGIAIEKSADQMDEIQYASERELAIRNVDRDSVLLRQVRAALRRVRDGSFGTPRSRAMGIALYPMSGGGRSGPPGARQ